MACATPTSQALAMAITHRRRHSDWRYQIQLRRRRGDSITCSAVAAFRKPKPVARSPDEQTLRLLLEHMKNAIHKTDSATYARVLNVCSKLKALPEGRRVHSFIRESGQNQDSKLGSTLVKMYLSCESLRDAQKAFDDLTTRDFQLWSSMISAYTERGYLRPAMKMFRRMMQAEDVSPDSGIFVAMLSTCGRMGALEEGKIVHSHAIRKGFANDLTVKTTLLNMYGKCGSVRDARKIFETIEDKDIAAWNEMLGLYVQYGEYEEAFKLYHKMELNPDPNTFLTMLNACAGAANLEDGRQLHSVIVEELETEDAISGALFNMYGRCGSLEEAWKYFMRRRVTDTAAWAQMISFYLQHNRAKDGLQLFRIMQLEGIRADKLTVTAALSTCNGSEDSAHGIFLHFCVQEMELEDDVMVRSALIHMYGRCGSYEDAWELFQESVTKKNVLLASSMITTCARSEHWQEIIDIFGEFESFPYKLTTLQAIKACTELKALETGKDFHERLREKDFYLDLDIREGLINMYCECGSLEDARRVFDGTAERRVTLWNTMIASYLRQEQVSEALELFEQMQAENIEPDSATINSILSVDEGCQLLKSLSKGDQRLAQLCREAGLRVEIEEPEVTSTTCVALAILQVSCVALSVPIPQASA